ncbi:MAG: hypothetical protein M0R49_08585 [Limnochordia bacterium]|nr:hypothetical protein [Limnochordia bacterium]
MKNDSTVVIFRKYNNGTVIAIFPEIPSTSDPYTCMSYEHVGQHGPCSIDIVSITKPAQWEEYDSLMEELKSIGYHLKVRNRLHPRYLQQRIEALKVI